MPYSITATEVDKIATALSQYYEASWHAGIMSTMDRMAHANMGTVTGYLDTAKDSFANLRKKSADSFRVTFKAELKQQMGLLFSNKSDVAAAFVTLGEAAINKLAELIPIPALGSVVTAITGFAAEKARDELHERSIGAADKLLAAQTGAQLQKFFTNDKDAIAFIQDSIKQYKTIGTYIDTLPKTIGSFDDAITYPASAFKVQQAASSLNIALWSIRSYLNAMSERLEQCQRVSAQYIQTVRSKMPAAVDKVLREAYDKGSAKGTADVNAGKYAQGAETQSAPKLKPPHQAAGGATQLAAYIAYVMALGYYDAWGRRAPKII